MKAGRKPGSVLRHLEPEGLELAGAIICLGPPLPTASSGSLESGRGSRPTVVPGPCSQPGFTEPAPLDAAGALLPHPCTLTCAPRKGPSAVCFCGTVLTVTRTGRYPASLAVGEPGLSSTGPGIPAQRPRSAPIAITSPAFGFRLEPARAGERGPVPAAPIYPQARPGTCLSGSGAVAQPDRATVS